MSKQIRSSYISSTELAAVFHCSHWGSRKKLYEKKLSKTFKQTPKSAAIHHGQAFEPLALKKAMEFLGTDLDWRKAGIVIDPFSVISCSPDAISPSMGLEVKCPAIRTLPETKEEILDDYLLQCFACIHVCKSPVWYLFYLQVSDGASVCFKFEPDWMLWIHKIVPKAKEFVEIIDVRDDKEGMRRKKKTDTDLWLPIRQEILNKVTRVK